MAEPSSSDSDSVESENDLDFSAVDVKSSKNPKRETSANANAKDERERRLCFLVYRDFLRYATSGTCDDRDKRKQAEKAVTDDDNYGLYADDKGYLQGEIYRELESEEEYGFAGDLAQELNLMPPDNVADHERTLQDAEPEIIVVPSARFVREISDGKHK